MKEKGKWMEWQEPESAKPRGGVGGCWVATAGQSQVSEGALPEPCSRPLTCGNVPFQVVRGTTVRTQHVSHTVLRRPMTCKNDSGRRRNGGLHTNGLGSVYACDAAVV